MTEITLSTRNTGIADAIRDAFTRLKDWLNEDVYAGPMPSEFPPRDWADLPTYHPGAAPTRDDRDAH
jgi:hypothetical protein